MSNSIVAGLRIKPITQSTWNAAHRKLATMQEQIGAMSVWSIYELFRNMDDVAYEGQVDFIYLGKDYWDWSDRTKPCEDGKVDIIIPLKENPTWLDIWKAADQAIRQCTDHHHIFIEDIKMIDHNGKAYLTMFCGS